MKKTLTLLMGCLFALGAAAQEPYPARPIRLVVAYGAGGATDLLARALGQRLSKQLGQPVIVENRPGAATLIGTSQVAKAQPDGHTLFVADTSFAMVPATRKSLPYDPIKDFAPIAHVASMPMVLLVPPSLGITSLKELRALANSKRITYASGGSGTVFHLVMELVRSATGIKADHVPYKGGAEVLIALVGGQVQFALGSVSTSQPFIKAGRLVPLAVITSGGRSPALPAVPTMAELGFKDLAMTQWFGILAPSGTNRDILRRLHTEVRKAMEAPEVHEPLPAQAGWELTTSAPDDLAKLISSDLRRWKIAADAAGLQPE